MYRSFNFHLPLIFLMFCVFVCFSMQHCRLVKWAEVTLQDNLYLFVHYGKCGLVNPTAWFKPTVANVLLLTISVRLPLRFSFLVNCLWCLCFKSTILLKTILTFHFTFWLCVLAV